MTTTPASEERFYHHSAGRNAAMGDGAGNDLVRAAGIAVDGAGNAYVAGIVSDNAFKITLAEQLIRGDSNGDGNFVLLVDVLHLLTFGFVGGPPPPCLEAADADGDAVQSTLPDALYILAHAFLGGPAPPAPYPDCGSDPDPATSLGCDASTCP